MIASNTNSLGGATNAFQPNGDYLAADALFVGRESRGHDSSVQVFRFMQTGTPDTSFADPSFHFQGAGGSGIEALPNAMAVQANGDIVVVGRQITFGLSTTSIGGIARLTPSGVLDSSFGNGGTVTSPSPFIGLAIQAERWQDRDRGLLKHDSPTGGQPISGAMTEYQNGGGTLTRRCALGTAHQNLDGRRHDQDRPLRSTQHSTFFQGARITGKT